MFGCLTQRAGLSQLSAGPCPFGTRKTSFATEPGRRGSRVLATLLSRHSPLALVFRSLAAAAAALGFSPLATLLSGSLATRSRRRGSRLSLGFTRSRLSGSLALASRVHSQSPCSRARRRHLSPPVVTTPRPRTSSICRSAWLSPLGFICFAVHLLSSASQG